jgi:hypothetical protein
MARWLHVGERKINLELVCAMEKAGEIVTCVFAGLSDEQLKRHCEFQGEEGRRIWNAAKDDTRIH